MRGGSVVHGPKSRDHSHDLPKKVRKLGLRCALSAKSAAGQLMVVDMAGFSEPKTQALAGVAVSFGWGSTLFIDGLSINENLERAARNMVKFDVLPARGANVYDILRHETLVLTRDGVAGLVERLS
jgi:large subunit ribosomal protein L4